MQRASLEWIARSQKLVETIRCGQKHQTPAVQKQVWPQPVLVQAARNIIQAGRVGHDHNLLADFQPGDYEL
jgi:hypothetical protein